MNGIFIIGFGILIIALGVVNMLGNISTLHSYHRHRVKPEDVKPLGRLVGIGTMLCGVGCITFGVFELIAHKAGNEALLLAGSIVLVSLIIVGCLINIFAIIKYNKGLF